MRLALFDLDNTLLAGDSDHAWGEFLCQRGLVDVDTYRARNDAFYQDYLDGKLDVHAYQNFCQELLGRSEMAQLERWHAEFMRARVAPMILPKGRALVRRHLEAGELCAIITATNSFVTAPIARELGVAHLIATEPERRDGRFTGRVAGTPCFRDGKLVRLDQWLAGLGRRMADFESSTCYSDSHNDLPLLQRVSRPVAVDPDPTLAREAERRGWERISLR